MQEMAVLYPDFVKVINAIKHKRDRCVAEGKGSAMMIFMPSGAGKSFLCRYLSRLWPSNHEGEASIVPFVTFQPPTSLTENKMGGALLKAMGDPAWEDGDTDDKKDRITTLTRKLNTTVLALDNAHDIVQNRREKGIILIGSWLRDVVDATGALLVLLGTSASTLLVKGNSQLGRRGCARYHVNHFSLETKADRSKYKRFLLELDKLLPLAQMSGLSEGKRALKIFWATNGIQDFIFQLMAEATISAVTNRREKITDSDLKLAFDWNYGDSGIGMNPFSEDCQNRVLDHEGEIFHEWFDLYNPDPGSFKRLRARG